MTTETGGNRVEQVSTVAHLGDVVRAARRAHGWSQQHAADTAGVSRRFVNMVEGGRHANAEVGRVLALLDALDVRLGALVPGAQPDTSPALDGRGRAHDPATRPADADSPANSGDDDIDLDAYLASFHDPRHSAEP